MDKELRIIIKLLEDELKNLQQELKDAHELLTEMRVPTNGVDINGQPGYGKRENLSLKQRIGYTKKI